MSLNGVTMARIDVVKMFKETPAFIFKNPDVILLYILVMVPAFITNSPLVNLKDLSQQTYIALWAAFSIYGPLVWLTLVAAILARLKNKKLSLVGAFKHVWKQLFTRGAWWYLIFSAGLYYGSVILQTFLVDQPESVRMGTMVLTFLLTIAAIYYTYIIVDDYRSIKDTVTRSLRYVGHSLVPFLKIMLLTILVVAPVSAAIYFLGTKAGFDPFNGDITAIPALMLAFYTLSLVVGYIYSIVFCKLYLQVKAQD